MDKNNRNIKLTSYKVINSNNEFCVFIQIPLTKNIIYFSDDDIISLANNSEKKGFPDGNNNLKRAVLWYFTELYGNTPIESDKDAGTITDISKKADSKLKETFEYNYAMGLIMKKYYPGNIDTNLYYFHKATILDTNNRNVKNEFDTLFTKKDSVTKIFFSKAKEIYNLETLDSNDYKKIIQYCDSILKGNTNFINQDTLKIIRYMKAYSIFEPISNINSKISQSNYEEIKLLLSESSEDCKSNLLLMNAHINYKNYGEAEKIYELINKNCDDNIKNMAEKNMNEFLEK